MRDFDTLASPQQYTDKVADDEYVRRNSFMLYVKTPNGRGTGTFKTESAPSWYGYVYQIGSGLLITAFCHSRKYLRRSGDGCGKARRYVHRQYV